MKKLNRLKLLLDLIMLIALMLLYNKNVFGLTFHEIAGLAVCGLFIIHILLNGKWVLVITGKLFSKKIAWRNKLNWLIDFLLLLSFAYILISGISISKVLFSGQRGASAMKTGHYAVSALALVLIGIHVGLHYSCVIQRLRLQKLPLALRRVTAIVLSAAILGFGIYEMTATSFLHWMGSLGTVIGTTSAELPEGGALPDGGAAPEAYAPTEEGTDLQAVSLISDSADTDGDSLLDAGGSYTASEGNGNGRGGGGQGNGKGNIAQASPSLLATVLPGFLSITLSFAVAVAWIDGIARRRKRRQQTACTV